MHKNTQHTLNNPVTRATQSYARPPYHTKRSSLSEKWTSVRPCAKAAANAQLGDLAPLIAATGY
jgi:hypothetical protein